VARPRGKALNSEDRPAVTTKEAAWLLNRRPQTLRKWACYGTGPIQPIRGHARLLWAVGDIQRLLKFLSIEKRKVKK